MKKDYLTLICCYTVRTFIASPVARTEGIEDLLSQVSLLPSVRVPGTRDLHLTYLFLGDIGERDVKSASEAVKAISIRKVVSGFSGITAFPDLSNPRVLVLIFDNPGILEIYKRISDLLPGFATRSRNFVPHLTIGRFGRDRINPHIEKLKVPDERVTIDRVCLFRSTLTPSGPIYEEIDSVQLI